ncbi:MAG: enoyl-CoA hydratase/isomerase family protein [Candidatus Eisenbacteria bacterium]|nr:enoyl-CoA hydratase/isomerase family protein [Candidatus Eisenbacteria bacterium]
MANVELIRDGAVARLWLNRPEQHNALAAELVAELVATFHALAHDDAVRVVVLAGRGKSFCAGADITLMKTSAAATFDENLAEARRLAGMFATLADLPKPVVARLHGNVLGGGVGLTCACDIAVAADDARFALSEVRLGILPAVISPYVIRRLGDRAARELMLTGERFAAAAALRAGLIHRAVPAADLDAAVDERVEALLAGAPRAQARIKTLLELYADSGWDEYRTAVPRVLAEVRSGDEAKDGLAAFFEKRPPKWMPGSPPAPPRG